MLFALLINSDLCLGVFLSMQISCYGYHLSFDLQQNQNLYVFTTKCITL